MFVRPCWMPKTVDEMYDLMTENIWALLVTNGQDGPHATNLPLMLDRTRGPHGTLVGHIARGNEHTRALESGDTPSLAIFEGPWSYVTGSWYPNRDMPSTYYYTAVHCYGRVRVQTPAELESALGVLTDHMEQHIPRGWKMTDVPHADITRRLPAIVGFEMPIERIEGKFKLGQDEPTRDALAVAARLEEAAEPSHRALAALIRHHNVGRK